MKLDRIVLAGNSMGGAVALQFALSQPKPDTGAGSDFIRRHGAQGR